MIIKDNVKALTGSEKSAIIFLCLGEARGATLMRELDSEEIAAVTHAMAGLGMVSSKVVEDVMTQFMESFGQGSHLVGNFETAERMLLSFLDERRVNEIMGEVRGPLMGKNMWERFSALNENVIANYLKGEYPQTVAAILSKVRPELAARVLPLLPKTFMMDVIERMIQMEAVPKDVLHDIEETLQKEFIASAARATSSDPLQKMAEVFNRFDADQFESIAPQLEADLPDSFARIKQMMFTFDDLIRLDPQALSRVMRGAEGRTLPLALKGAKPNIRTIFLNSMPERSRNILIEEMQAMGPVRMREVQQAQSELVGIAKALAENGDIQLPSSDEDDAVIE